MKKRNIFKSVSLVFALTFAIGCSNQSPVSVSSVTSNGENMNVAATPLPEELASATDGAGVAFVFAKKTDGTIHFRFCASGANWNTTWQAKGGSFKGNIVMEKDKNNLLYVFATGTDNIIKYIKQSAVGSSTWSNWTALPGYGLLGGKLAVTTFGNGSSKQIMLFFLNADNNLCYSMQNSGGGFSNGGVLNGSEIGFATPQFAVGRNSQGNVEIVGANANGTLYRKYYYGYFYAWSPLSAPGNYTGEIAMISNSDGRLEVFACNPAGHCYGHSYEFTPGSSNWSSWEVLSQASNYTCTRITVGRNPDGRLETFFNGANGNVMHQYQSSANNYWLEATLFENGQPATSRHIATATYGVGGRLFVFVISTAQAVTYSVQHCVNCYWEKFINL